MKLESPLAEEGNEEFCKQLAERTGLEFKPPHRSELERADIYLSSGINFELVLLLKRTGLFMLIWLFEEEDPNKETVLPKGSLIPFELSPGTITSVEVELLGSVRFENSSSKNHDIKMHLSKQRS